MRPHRLEPPGLVLLAVAPTLFVTTLYLARTGRDLTTAFLAGSALLGLVGVLLLGFGIRMSHAGRLFAGILMLVSVLYFFMLASTIEYWVGSRETDLIVKVRDADTGQGIGGAAVEISMYRGERIKVQADPIGVAQLRWHFSTAGETSLTRRTGCIRLFYEELAVDAAGYQKVREPLEKRLGPVWDLHGPPLPVVQVALKKVTQ